MGATLKATLKNRDTEEGFYISTSLRLLTKFATLVVAAFPET